MLQEYGLEIVIRKADAFCPKLTLIMELALKKMCDQEADQGTQSFYRNCIDACDKVNRSRRRDILTYATKKKNF